MHFEPSTAWVPQPSNGVCTLACGMRLSRARLGHFFLLPQQERALGIPIVSVAGRRPRACTPRAGLASVSAARVHMLCRVSHRRCRRCCCISLSILTNAEAFGFSGTQNSESSMLTPSTHEGIWFGAHFGSSSNDCHRAFGLPAVEVQACYGGPSVSREQPEHHRKRLP